MPLSARPQRKTVNQQTLECGLPTNHRDLPRVPEPAQSWHIALPVCRSGQVCESASPIPENSRAGRQCRNVPERSERGLELAEVSFAD